MGAKVNLKFSIEPGPGPKKVILQFPNAIPATTASVERLFSSAGLTFTQRRTRLSPSQIDNILFIRLYEKFKNKQ